MDRGAEFQVWQSDSGASKDVTKECMNLGNNTFNVLKQQQQQQVSVSRFEKHFNSREEGARGERLMGEERGARLGGEVVGGGGGGRGREGGGSIRH